MVSYLPHSSEVPDLGAADGTSNLAVRSTWVLLEYAGLESRPVRGRYGAHNTEG